MTLSHAPSPDTLDEEAARLHESAVWQELVASWPTTAPPEETCLRPAAPQEEWRALLSVPVADLVAEAARALPAPDPAVASPLPGRVGAVLPDRLYGWRRAGRVEVLPSVHMAFARRVLVEWGGRTVRTGCGTCAAPAACAAPCSPPTASATAAWTPPTARPPGS